MVFDMIPVNPFTAHHNYNAIMSYKIRSWRIRSGISRKMRKVRAKYLRMACEEDVIFVDNMGF